MKDIGESRLTTFILGVAFILLCCIGISVTEFRTTAKQSRQKIGMIMTGAKNEDGWNKVQYEGLRDAAKQHGMDVIVREHVRGTLDEFKSILDNFSARGIRRVVVTQHQYSMELRELFRKYPDIEFILQTTEFSEENMVSCSTRLFEVQYLAGLIAGYQTETGVVGYVAPFSCVEVNRGLNAFTIGVKRANPTAHVRVAWTGNWNMPDRERAAVESLRAEDADVLSYQQDSRTVADAAESMGIDYIDAHEPHPEHKHCLTAVQSDWQSVYSNILGKRIRRDRMSNANNYFWRGFMEHVVLIAPLSEQFSLKAREAITRSVIERTEGKHLIYGGEIYDSNGVKRCDAKEILSNEYLRTRMVWQVRGVESVE